MDYMVGLFGRHFFSVVAIKGGIGSPLFTNYIQ